MKKILITLTALFIVFYGFAQKGPPPQPSEHPPLIRPSSILPIDCSELSAPNCNYIRNNNFEHPNYDYNGDVSDPFGKGKVPEWYVASGSPTIYDGVTFNDPPPTGVSGYFFAAVDTY